MKWLIDEMLPHDAAHELSAMGHDAVAVADRDMRGTPDSEVFELAVGEQRVVVTENFADFAALVEQRQNNNEPCTATVFVRKSAFAARGALASRLAQHLDNWATANPDPYHGVHWP